MPCNTSVLSRLAAAAVENAYTYLVIIIRRQIKDNNRKISGALLAVRADGNYFFVACSCLLSILAYIVSKPAMLALYLSALQWGK